MPTAFSAKPRVSRAGKPPVFVLARGPQKSFGTDPGDVADLTGNYAAGVRTGGASWVDGPWGPCLSFDGTGNVTTSVFPTWKDFTVSLWFDAVSAAAAFSRIVDCAYDTSFWLGRDGSGTATNWGGGVRQSGAPYGTFGTVSPNAKWHHLSMTRIGTAQTIYADGLVIATATVPATALSGVRMDLGALTDLSSPYTGQLANLFLYDYGISAQQNSLDFGDPDRWYRDTRGRSARRSVFLATFPAPVTATFANASAPSAAVFNSGTVNTATFTAAASPPSVAFGVNVGTTASFAAASPPAATGFNAGTVNTASATAAAGPSAAALSATVLVGSVAATFTAAAGSPAVAVGVYQRAPAAPIRVAVEAALKGSPAVQSLVGTRVYPLVLTEKRPPPALLYALQSDVKGRNLSGPNGTSAARFEFVCVSRTLSDGQNLAESVRNLIDGLTNSTLGLPGGGSLQLMEVTHKDESDSVTDSADGTAQSFFLTSFVYSIRYRVPTPAR
jgi:hypothetical protein